MQLLCISCRTKPYCIVESQFISEGPDELSIEPGDKVILLERINDDWLKGALNQRTGIFPSAFVNVKVDLPVLSKQAADESMLSSFGKYDILNASIINYHFDKRLFIHHGVFYFIL